MSQSGFGDEIKFPKFQVPKMNNGLIRIVVLGVLIFVHELGHFIAAKSVGIGVPRFSIGLGPRTPIHFMWGETEFVLSWIPFGGYVKMASKEELEATARARNFRPPSST